MDFEENTPNQQIIEEACNQYRCDYDICYLADEGVQIVTVVILTQMMRNNMRKIMFITLLISICLVGCSNKENTYNYNDLQAPDQTYEYEISDEDCIIFADFIYFSDGGHIFIQNFNRGSDIEYEQFYKVKANGTIIEGGVGYEQLVNINSVDNIRHLSFKEAMDAGVEPSINGYEFYEVDGEIYVIQHLTDEDPYRIFSEAETIGTFDTLEEALASVSKNEIAEETENSNFTHPLLDLLNNLNSSDRNYSADDIVNNIDNKYYQTIYTNQHKTSTKQGDIISLRIDYQDGGFNEIKQYYNISENKYYNMFRNSSDYICGRTDKLPDNFSHNPDKITSDMIFSVDTIGNCDYAGNNYDVVSVNRIQDSSYKESYDYIIDELEKLKKEDSIFANDIYHTDEVTGKEYTHIEYDQLLLDSYTSDVIYFINTKTGVIDFEWCDDLKTKEHRPYSYSPHFVDYTYRDESDNSYWINDNTPYIDSQEFEKYIAIKFQLSFYNDITEELDATQETLDKGIKE